MARSQFLRPLANVVCVTAGVAYPLTSDTDLWVKSVLIQSVPTNTGDIFFGDDTIQNIALTTGRSATIQGDNMDNGTAAKIQLSSIYVVASVSGEEVAITPLENL